jgi:hypothetical protein
MCAPDQVLKQPVDKVLLVDADVAVTEEVVFQRAKFNDARCGDVFDVNRGKIGKAGKWAYGGELIGIDRHDDVLPRILIRKGLQHGNVNC